MVAYLPEHKGSNIEARVLAHYLADKFEDDRMAQAFIEGADLHQRNADAWGVSRSDAKTLLYACVPMSTQALTRYGWKYRHELSIGDEILGYNPRTQMNEWTKITGFTPTQYAELTEWSIGKGFTVASTHNHRWYGSKRVQSGNTKTSFRYTKDIEFITDEVTSEHIIKQAAQCSYIGTGLCLNRLVNKYTEDNLWSNLVLQMTKSELWSWFSANIATDGYFDKHGQPRFTQDTTKQPGLFDAMVLAGYLLGYNPSVGTSNSCSVVCFAKRQTRTLQRVVKKTLPEQEVWCLITELGSWVMRQGNTITITGNCLYGAGATKVGKGDKARGQALMDTVDRNAPAISQLKDACWENAAKRGGVGNDLFGRPLVCPAIVPEIALEIAESMESSPREAAKVARGLTAQAKRQMFNALLQGSAATCLKILTLIAMPIAKRYGGKLAASIHDELQFYIPTCHAENFSVELEEVFKTPLLSRCPIKGDAKVGLRWSETH